MKSMREIRKRKEKRSRGKKKRSRIEITYLKMKEKLNERNGKEIKKDRRKELVFYLVVKIL